MAIQQLTQPILNPIVAFDATKTNTITFVVIGGAQVIGNRLIISDNRTGEQVYNQIQSTMKLEHTIAANILKNGNYYNAVIYTIDNSNNESAASIAVPFYCYSEPVLTINNIPTSQTIENGTYTFSGTYMQQENEILNSYQYILYDSNRDILSKSDLIYYETDNSLAYTFVGMSNDTSYYIELKGQTVNGTEITSGLKYFTVRYLQPASFAICDLVNNCNDGYIQISSNIVAIDGHSYPEPPTYIDDKEVDLRNPNSWVEWNEGFQIQNDFTLRAWGRDFTPYQNIITLTNETGSDSSNKIELKWMLGDVIKKLPEYKNADGYSINLTDSENDFIKSFAVRGNTLSSLGQNGEVEELYSVGDIKNLININDLNINYNQDYGIITFTDFKLNPNYIYTLSFDYNINNATTDLYFSVGYGKDNSWGGDITSDIQYNTLSDGRNVVTFSVPNKIESGEPFPNDLYLYIKFAKTIILADVNVDIKNVQLESGSIATAYQSPNLYNIYPIVTGKNIYNYNSPLYIIANNISYSNIQNGYNIQLQTVNEESYLSIGFKNILNANDTYTLSYNYQGNLLDVKLYATDKSSQNIINEISLENGTFVAPNNIYDLQLKIGIDSSDISNNLEIWNIQIEANNMATEYENYMSSGITLTLDSPLMAPFGETSSDLIALQSLNLLNPNTKSANVVGNTTYSFMQDSNNTYYLWYYNSQNNLIKFLDEEGNEKSGVVITGNGAFVTHEDCTKITITKTNKPTADDITTQEILDNHIYIEKDYVTGWYPYFDTPSIIKKNKQLILNGTEDWVKRENTEHTFEFANSEMIKNGIAEYYPTLNSLSEIDTKTGIYLINTQDVIITDLNYSDVNDFKLFLTNNKKKVQYMCVEPTITPLTEDQISSLESLKTFSPNSNVFTNNEVLGAVGFLYSNGYSEQQTQNAYVQLKCYNSNNMYYFSHSNYIDIPVDTSKVFIWLRRKNNLFDLKIEDIGEYNNEEDNGEDKNNPVVSLDINQENITQSEIPVTANSIDDTGLKTVRFSKDNGSSWDEVVTVDGLSSTNSYTFTNLSADTFYTIRVEAIDLAGNIGGISQRVTTKA